MTGILKKTWIRNSCLRKEVGGSVSLEYGLVSLYL